MPRARLRAICIAFPIATAAAYLVALRPAGHRAGAYIALHLVLTALMLGAWRLSRERRDDALWVIAAGLAARAILIACPAFTTTDITRYLWEGRALLSGFDPYRVPPAAPALASLRHAWPLPFYPELPTLYPPAALAAFSLAAAAGPHHAFVAWKLLVVLASMATVLLGAALARSTETLRHLSLLALSPILVLETGVGAHVDALATLCLELGLLLFVRKRAAAAGAALGLGGAVKLLPLVAVLPLALARRGADRARLAGAAVAMLAGSYAIAWACGLHPPGSAGTFIAHWRFGAPLFSAIGASAGSHALLVAAGLGLAGVAALALWPGRAVWSSARDMMLVVLGVGPVVFPWYLSVLTPLTAVAPSGPALAWLSAAPFTYEVIDAFDAQRAWHPAAWPLWLAAGAVAAALIASWRGRYGAKLMAPGARGSVDSSDVRTTAGPDLEPGDATPGLPRAHRWRQ